MKDWRDENMPVTVPLKRDGQRQYEEWEPKRFQRAIAHHFRLSQIDLVGQVAFPHWSQDPTYNLRKRKGDGNG